MKKASLQLETLVCPSCSLKIEGALKQLDGVEKDSISVLFNASKVKFNFNDEIVSIDMIHAAIQKVGFEVLKSNIKE
ncbi:MAG: heavy-metal-associated domain-containing protein [Erysipelotrichia bacterium]|jgi:copper chaperone CopZ|nr:heavy-metal-associated domain-containing protein [Erysipelotrichia bacterium]